MGARLTFRLRAHLLLTLLTAMFATSVAAQNRVSENTLYGGLVKLPGTADHRFQASTAPFPLPQADPSIMARPGNRGAAGAAARLILVHPEIRGLLLLDQGRVVFSGLGPGASADTQFYGMSMSKSLMSLAVGQALCRGLIRDLSDRASDYLPGLKREPNYGRASIADLLTMRSGAALNRRAGSPDITGFGYGRRSFGWLTRTGKTDVPSLIWGPLRDSIPAADRAPFPPGDTFIYSNGDSEALGLLLRQVSGKTFARFFADTVLSQVPLQHDGHIEQDRLGNGLVSRGFQFALHDWGRLAQWVMLARGRDDCFGHYLRQATSRQTANACVRTCVGRQWASYGYQMWMDHYDMSGYWWLGYGGQTVATDPVSGRILVKFSTHVTGAGNRALGRLYRDWTAAGQRVVPD